MNEQIEALAKRLRKQPLWQCDSRTRSLQYGVEEIEKILPHRGPALLLRRIHAIDEAQRAIAAEHRIDRHDPAFEGHFPGDPVYPGAMQVELIGQAGICAVNLCAALPPSNTPRQVRVLKVHRAGFCCELRPDIMLTVLARVLVHDELTSVVAGQLLNANTVCAFAILELYFV